MFMAAVLVCVVDASCTYRVASTPYPNKFYCGLAIREAVDHFKGSDKVQYVEGRCIQWGNLAGNNL